MARIKLKQITIDHLLSVTTDDYLRETLAIGDSDRASEACRAMLAVADNADLVKLTKERIFFAWDHPDATEVSVRYYLEPRDLLSNQNSGPTVGPRFIDRHVAYPGCEVSFHDGNALTMEELTLANSVEVARVSSKQIRFKPTFAVSRPDYREYKFDADQPYYGNFRIATMYSTSTPNLARLTDLAMEGKERYLASHNKMLRRVIGLRFMHAAKLPGTTGGHGRKVQDFYRAFIKNTVRELSRFDSSITPLRFRLGKHELYTMKFMGAYYVHVSGTPGCFVHVPEEIEGVQGGTYEFDKDTTFDTFRRFLEFANRADSLCEHMNRASMSALFEAFVVRGITVNVGAFGELHGKDTVCEILSITPDKEKKYGWTMRKYVCTVEGHPVRVCYGKGEAGAFLMPRQLNSNLVGLMDSICSTPEPPGGIRARYRRLAATDNFRDLYEGQTTA